MITETQLLKATSLKQQIGATKKILSDFNDECRYFKNKLGLVKQCKEFNSGSASLHDENNFFMLFFSDELKDLNEKMIESIERKLKSMEKEYSEYIYNQKEG